MRSFSVSKSRNRSSDKNNKSMLPRISARNRSINQSGFLDKTADDSSILFENPFYIPPDEELLNHREQQKEARASVRKQEQNLKVWEKGPDHSMRHKLRKFLANSFIEEKDQNEHEEAERMNIMEAAKSAIKNRLRNREPLKDFLAKKKEMFLFQLNINEKKEQIKEFEELAHLQDVSLQQSMHMLEKDATTFHKYVEESKSTAIHAVRRAEDELKEVQKLNNVLNKNEEALSNSISKNARKIELLERLYTYKIFIDKLTPKEWFIEENKLVDERPRSSQDFRARKYEDNDRITFNWEKYQIYMSEQLKAFLAKNLDQYKMHFQKQEQLKMIFETLEEKNLFIMRHIQELEQNIETLKHNFGEKKRKLTDHMQQLQKNKKDLERMVHVKHKEIEHLKSVDNQSGSDTIHLRLEKALKNIYMNRRVLGEVKNEHEKDGFEMLKEIEKKLDSQAKELDNFKPQRVMDLVKSYKQRRREEATLLKKEQEENEKKLKALHNLKRLDTHKRMGRPIMARSHLKKVEKQEVKKDVLDPEEVEKQLYFTKRFG